MPYDVIPIGTISSGRADHGSSDRWGDVLSVVTIDPDRFGAGALAGLEDFSHAEILFLFDRLPERDDYTTPQRSRGREDLPPVGVFCDRGPRRPNRIGATICRIVEVSDNTVTVRGLDAVVDSPVLDIKPVMRQFLPGEVAQPEWVDRLMGEYFLGGQLA